MATMDFQKQVLSTLTEMKSSVETLKKDMDYLKDHIKDTKLSEEERKLLNNSISKVISGDTSDFIPWKNAKKQLGI